MYKLIDIVGSKIDEFDNIFLKVYINNKNKYSYILTIQYQDCGEINFRFNSDNNKNSNDIDKFYKFLKSNGCEIKFNDSIEPYYELIGKSLMKIDDDSDMIYTLCKYNTNPIDEELIDSFDDPISNLSLLQVLNNEFGEGHGYI